MENGGGTDGANGSLICCNKPGISPYCGLTLGLTPFGQNADDSV